MSDNEDEKLIFVGFTNPYQIRYAKDDSGSFYPDTENGCYIPLYMLKRHENRLHTGEQLAPTVEPKAVDGELLAEVNEAGAKACSFLSLDVFQMPENNPYADDLHQVIDTLQKCRDVIQSKDTVSISRKCAEMARNRLSGEYERNKNDPRLPEYKASLKSNVDELNQALEASK